MLKMSDIYMGMEKALKEIEPAFEEAQKKYEYFMAEAEKADATIKELETNVISLKNALKALEQGDFSALNNEIEKKNEEEAKKPKPVIWHKKNPDLVRYDATGKEIGRYSSQKKAAIALHWDQSGVCRFMKLSKEAQIKRKQFYFAYEH